MTWQLMKVGSVSLVLAGLIACSAADSDDDGLSNSREAELGTNPDKADTDSDGLDDRNEIKLGTDPLVNDTDGDGLLDGDEGPAGADPLIVDTDGDGYTDRDEVFTGHSPADPKDRIYKANWPYFFEKDTLTGGALDKPIKEGKTVGHLIGKDWNGDDVDLWDFHNADKPIIVDVSAQWCPPCNDLAKWLHNDPNVAPAYDAYWPGIREAVENGDVYWVTILTEQQSGDPAVLETSQQWHGVYPDKPIPVIADHQEEMESYLQLQYFPTVFLLQPDLTVDFAEIAPNPYSDALDQMVQQLQAR